ncbi:Crp/Fnr family transcriptional regulator [Bacillus sp. OK048]|uniref:Crp/Fnr family transcriptional regulator n=1 Tax=Bacillus sp. OK048 TaxID=1882761 RepID=UPI00088C09E1|nr:Crp/Fnr family transcriptional regulator [Bacillus sp. OK048]SDM48155.1 cAMP-binding domain of CRP or a regulatory subunit of cAMP-dependent protein kinases [Bacillus sp. OK048]
MLVYLNQLSESDFSCLEMIKKEGTVSCYSKNSVLFQQEDFGDCAYVPIKGIAKVGLTSIAGQMRTISYLTPGIFFGQSAAFLGFAIPSSLTVMAVTDLEVLSVPKDTILDLMHQSTDFAAYMLKCSGLMISNLQNHIEVMSFGDANFQVATLLNSLPKQLKKGKEYVSISQEEIASIIGKSRVTVGNTIKRLQDLKIISLVGYKTIVIENKEELTYLASELQASNE